MNPAYLATLVFIGSNYKVYMPAKNEIWQRYLRKFSKGGKLLGAELGLASTAPKDTDAWNPHCAWVSPPPGLCLLGVIGW